MTTIELTGAYATVASGFHPGVEGRNSFDAIDFINASNFDSASAMALTLTDHVSITVRSKTGKIVNVSVRGADIRALAKALRVPKRSTTA